MFIDEKFVEVCFDKIRGRGSSSIIYEAVLHTQSPLFITSKKQAEKNNKNNEKVVIKIVNKFGHDDFEQVLREVNASLKIGIHKHVCCLLGWSLYLTTHALIYECVDGYDLHTWLKLYANALGLITEMQIAKILWQISDGMEHISAVGIVHRDLAARNILLTKTLEVKITDFGLASICNKQFIYQAQINRRLPIRWMAPESLGSRLFSEASDIWSFGVLIWEIFTFGDVPYNTMEEGEDIVDFISRGNTLILPYKTGLIWQILTRDCWKLNRDERPNFRAIRNLIGQFLEEKTINYGYLRCKSE
uniref:receptor protein-tyrosine kinase n=1 Tax=Panagrolaimus davidi TaxID=227884 RepID=A0A914Q1K4_9BILA